MKKLLLVPFLFSTLIKADFDSNLRAAGNEDFNQWLNVQEMGRKVDEHRTRIKMLEIEFQEALDNYMKQQEEELRTKGLPSEKIEQEIAIIKAAKVAEVKEFANSFGESKGDQTNTPVLGHALLKELENEILCGDAALKILALRLMSEKVWLGTWVGFWEISFQSFLLKIKENKK